jgi:hypothetical protein
MKTSSRMQTIETIDRKVTAGGFDEIEGGKKGRVCVMSSCDTPWKILRKRT